MFLFQHSASQHGNKGKYFENVRMYLEIVSANTLPQPPTRGEKNAPFVGSAPHRAIVADPQPNNTRRDLSLSRQNKEVSNTNAIIITLHTYNNTIYNNYT